jgi:invasion protein IalB
MLEICASSMGKPMVPISRVLRIKALPSALTALAQPVMVTAKSSCVSPIAAAWSSRNKAWQTSCENSATYERPSSARKQATVESCSLSQEINFVNFGMMIFAPPCNAVSDPT